ncbi:MAG: hypothetical protein ACE15F_07995 [bacterium]
MPGLINRGSFLKQAAVSATPDTPAAKLPTGKIGPLTISRVICGGNLISGWAHSRDLMYVPELFRQYFTDEKVLETFALCEENGINTFLSDPRERPMRVIRKFWDERGGTMQWIAEGHPKVDDIKTNLQLSIDNGACAIYIQGGVADNWVLHNRLDLLAQAVEFIKANGLVAGIGAHSLQVPMTVEKQGIPCDFYMKTLHHDQYWSATPKENRLEFNVDVSQFPEHGKDHDNIWCINPEETAAFMKTVKKPWIAFKTLAAGAIHPREAFPYAFKNGADFVCVGMCDFHVTENAVIARNVLAQDLQRERPWCA